MKEQGNTQRSLLKILIALLLLAAAFFGYRQFFPARVVTVGFIYDNDETAPYTTLAGTRINWTPYILGAVKAVMDNKPIEKTVSGTVHSNQDMSAGFKENWVEMTRLNTAVLPEGAQEQLKETIQNLRDGKVQVFRGDYTGGEPQ